MAARSGREFLERLAAARVHVEIQGETLTGHINDHPAFRNVIRSYAGLYDMQHDPAYRDVLTYPSPTSGQRVATSFLTPRTPEDLQKRREAFKLWADRSFGMLGRTPDYLNSALMALAAAGDWFAQADPKFGQNVRRSQPVSQAVPAVSRDLAQARRLRPDGHAHLGRRDRAGRGRHRDLPAGRRPGPGPSGSGCSGWSGTPASRPSRAARPCTSTTFFGDPVRMAGAYMASYDREPYKAAVRAFLDRS